ncbi:MAG: SET domain-containing protein-lysine N-methyltransferase [Gammaproteobacteria bacterium]
MLETKGASKHPLNGNGHGLQSHLGHGQYQRFYPDQLPAFAHEPTRDRFQIRHISDGVGEGVVALVPFAVGAVVCAFTGFLTSEVTQFTLQIGRGRHLHDPYFYGKTLHSCDHNCFIDVKKRQFIAIKPIAAGNFVTFDYAQTEDYLFLAFPCSCGAINCRGKVLGRKQKDTAARGHRAPRRKLA